MHSLQELAGLTGGKLRGADARFAGVAIDSRTLAPRQLFFALPGERTDGHRFIAAAQQQGAAAAVVERYDDCDLPQIKVAGCLDALEALARERRRNFWGAVVAVTGSSGKTTVKEMLRSVLSQMGPVLAPPKSYNNRLGVSLTLASLEDRHRYAVMEVGSNAPGEIARLAELVQPAIALITNAGRAHLEHFGSLQRVAVEKGSLLSALGEEDFAVLPSDDPFFRDWAQRVNPRRTVSYGRNELSDCRLVRTRQPNGKLLVEIETAQGRLSCELHLAGAHNGLNAAGAAAVAQLLGARRSQIAQGLSETRPMGGRLNCLPGPGGSRLYDDSYNANPDSVRRAIDFLATRRGRRVLVLGDMAELGEASAAMHESVGRYAREKGIDELYAMGDMAEMTVSGFGGCGGRVCGELDALVNALRDGLHAQTIVLVKGSRMAKMERVIDLLRQESK